MTEPEPLTPEQQEFVNQVRASTRLAMVAEELGEEPGPPMSDALVARMTEETEGNIEMEKYLAKRDAKKKAPGRP